MRDKRILTLLLLAAMTLAALMALFWLLEPTQAAPAKETAVSNTLHALTNNPAGQVIRTAAPLSQTTQFAAFLTGDQEVPPVATGASGVARFTLVSTDTLEFEVAVRDIISITASHIHLGAPGVNGGVVFPLYTGTGDFDPDHPISGTLTLSPTQLDDLLAGDTYINVHTSAYPAGEIRGQILTATTQAFQTALSGADEVPPVDSRASGEAFLTLSPDMSQLNYRLLVADISDITASHIHEAPTGQNGGVIFPLYTGVGAFDPDNPISGVLTPTLSQVAAMLAGDYYINVHTLAYPAGEIRGQVAAFTPRSDYHALLTGAEEVPPVDTTAVGVGRFALSDDLTTLDFHVAVTDIVSVTAAHLHIGWPGQNGGVAHLLYGGGGTFGPGSPITGLLTLDSQDLLDLMSGYYYANVHTTQFPAGEIRGQVEGASLFATNLTGDQEVPPVNTTATGKAILALNDDASMLHYRVMVSDIPTITAAHIHLGAVGQNGPITFPLYTGSGPFDQTNPISGTLSLTDANLFDLLAGDYYINVHTTNTPSGEIRGQLGPLAPAMHHEAALTGDQEVPPVATAASGQGYFTLDDGRNSLHYFVGVSDILGVTAAHIHKGPFGVNGPVIFPLYTGSGSFDPAHPVGGGVTLSAENLVDLLTGYYYVNVHTTAVPSGEIRGQIGVTPFRQYFPILVRN